MKICKVKGDYIQLNQLLKLENIVSTGGEARQLIEHGMVRVNGEKAEAIRKKIKMGDKVEVSGEILLIETETES
ncbi:MAG: RNA-binding S4 domain-containing protein [Lachnospiraceae bacterium]|nr:RNA-binding S4 domain-containing protein [Lachnospiraceae bacterium]